MYRRFLHIVCIYKSILVAWYRYHAHYIGCGIHGRIKSPKTCAYPVLRISQPDLPVHCITRRGFDDVETGSCLSISLWSNIWSQIVVKFWKKVCALFSTVGQKELPAVMMLMVFRMQWFRVPLYILKFENFVVMCDFVKIHAHPLPMTGVLFLLPL